MMGFFIMSISSCSDTDQSQQKPIIIDFIDSLHAPEFPPVDTVQSVLRVAISSMISPKETFAYYGQLIKYIAKQAGMEIELKQRKTYREVNELLKLGVIDFAFICSGAYVEPEMSGAVELLTVPVVQGQPTYQAYVIVNAQSSFRTFADLKGKTFAFTDPLSNTGCLYPVSRVIKLGSTADQYFAKTFYTYGHDYSIQLVARGIVDAASVDGLIYEYQKRFAFERVKDLRVIEISERYGIPPVVVRKHLSTKLKKKLQGIFLSIAETDEGKMILDKLSIDRFVLGRNVDYSSIKQLKKIVNR